MKRKCITLVSKILASGMVFASIFLCSTGGCNADIVLDSRAIQMSMAAGIAGGMGEIKQGDVTGDGSVNSIDFAHMWMYLLGMSRSVINDSNELIADLNGDKEFNAIDLGIMRGYLLGKISGFSKPVATATPVSIPTPAASNDDYTDSISDANYFMKVNSPISGSIDFEGDIDYMIFEPPTSGKYRFDIYTKPDITLGYLYVEKVHGWSYSYNSFDTYTNSKGCYIEEELTGGTRYYFGMKNKDNMTSLDVYTIRITKL